MSLEEKKYSTNEYMMEINTNIVDNDKKLNKRRRRMVKNEIVTIDDIKESAGENFTNWIKITKRKLLVKHYIIILQML